MKTKIILVAIAIILILSCCFIFKANVFNKDNNDAVLSKTLSERLNSENAASENHVRKHIAKSNAEFKEESAKVIKTEESANADSNQAIETSPIEPLWVADNTIVFSIHDRDYLIGGSCSDILYEFEIIETKGHFDANGNVPVCEKIVIRLSDTHGNSFLIVARNDMSQPIPLIDCTLHEVIVEAEDFDLSKFRAMGLNGDVNADMWLNALGADYSDFSYLDTAVHSWVVAEKCYVDISFNAETKETTRINVLTY